MEKLVITEVRAVGGEDVLPLGHVLCEGGVITAVRAGRPDTTEGWRCVDGGGAFLAPGFIDLHIHGLEGILFSDGRNALGRGKATLPKYGVTAFLPTLTPADDDAALLRDLAGAGGMGSTVLGFFLEGHYLKLTGAISKLDADYSLERLEALFDAAGPFGLVFGVSPEIEDLGDLLPRMAAGGYPAFITHTMANARQTEAAIGLGARHATHFYDVFPYIGDKEPGVRGCGTVEAILASPDTSVDFILDGEHVDPVAVKLALACKGPDKVCLITDANVNAGLPPGRYEGLDGVEVVVSRPGGPARMSERSETPGVLAGSGLTMDQAVRNAVDWLGLPLPRAVAMASANPARVLGIHHKKGRVQAGYDADLVLLDAALQVRACFVGGEQVFSAC